MAASHQRKPGRIKIVSRKSKPVRVSNQHLLPDLDPTSLRRYERWLYRRPGVSATGFAVCDFIALTAITYWRSSKPLGESIWYTIPHTRFLSLFMYFMFRHYKRRYLR